MKERKRRAPCGRSLRILHTYHAALQGEQIPPDPTLREERELLKRHFDLICRRFGEEKGSLLMRKYACCYAQGRRGARKFRAHVAVISTPEEFHEVVNAHFPR